MSTEINDGGPAYPWTEFDQAGSLYRQHPGMHLRDYFAANAMQGMLAVPDDQRYGDRADKALTIEQWQAWCVTGVVEHAYRVADAMLKARGAA
jgi:hypothetical protein